MLFSTSGSGNGATMTVEGKSNARMVIPAPVEVQYKGMRFLITHNPTSSSMNDFVSILKQHETDTVVRVCESTYDKENLTNEGFQFMDWVFDDGTAPPSDIVQCWLDLLKSHAKLRPNNTIAIHCVAGLGRAPVLVALALIENGMTFEQAVDLIRQKRRGAINTKQLEYLESYKPKHTTKVRHGSKTTIDKKQCCIQ